MNYLASKEKIKSLLPHKEPMILIDTLKECDIKSFSGCCITEVGKHYNVALNDDYSLPTYALIEVMAQTTAACISYCNQYQKLPCPKIGFLLSVRDFKIRCTGPIQKGSILESVSETVYQENTFLQCYSKVYESNNLICEATLIVYIPQQ